MPGRLMDNPLRVELTRMITARKQAFNQFAGNEAQLQNRPLAGSGAAHLNEHHPFRTTRFLVVGLDQEETTWHSYDGPNDSIAPWFSWI